MSRAACRRAAPDLGEAWYVRGWALAMAGDEAEGLDCLLKGLELWGVAAERLPALRAVFEAKGFASGCGAAADLFAEQPLQFMRRGLPIAGLRALADQRDEAFAILDAAAARGDPTLIFFPWIPFVRPGLETDRAPDRWRQVRSSKADAASFSQAFHKSGANTSEPNEMILRLTLRGGGIMRESPTQNGAVVAPSEAFGLKTYYVLLLAQAVSLLGSQVSGLAVSIAIFRQTGHATPLALVAFFSAAPRIVLGGSAGAMADRFDRRRIMLLANVGYVVASALLLASFASGAFRLWHLYLLVLGSATCAAIEAPAFQASVAMLVPDSHRDRANAIGMVRRGRIAGVLAPTVSWTALRDRRRRGLYLPGHCELRGRDRRDRRGPHSDAGANRRRTCDAGFSLATGLRRLSVPRRPPIASGPLRLFHGHVFLRPGRAGPQCPLHPRPDGQRRHARCRYGRAKFRRLGRGGDDGRLGWDSPPHSHGHARGCDGRAFLALAGVRRSRSAQASSCSCSRSRSSKRRRCRSSRQRRRPTFRGECSRPSARSPPCSGRRPTSS